MKNETNPLLAALTQDFIPFSEIQSHHILPAIETLINHNQKQLTTLLSLPKPTFDTLIWPLEKMENALNETFETVSHLNAVVNSADFHDAYQNALSKLSLYHTELWQNKGLYEAILTISKREDYTALSAPQQKIIQNALRDFKLSGITLSAPDQETFKSLSVELSELESQFEQNVLEATQAWRLVVTDEADLKGLPEEAVERAALLAAEKGISGWILTLDYPCYHAVMTYLEKRELRETLYQAYVTRASQFFPVENATNNSPVMVRILQLRQALAHLLGFKHYAAYALCTRMLKQPEEAFQFLENLVSKAKTVAETEIAELKAFAAERVGLADLQMWDRAYVSEKMLQARYEISEALLRPYFPLDAVLKGVFLIFKKLYGMEIKEINGPQVWEASVRLFEAYDETGALRGRFYLDAFSRENKRSGAWVGGARVRFQKGTDPAQIPTAYVITNFSKGAHTLPALLSHDEVVTLFHELGHCAHVIFSRVDYPSVSGFNGVPWDGVELPSQLMENWCWEPEAISLFSRHIETEAPLPMAFIQKLKDSQRFQVGLYLSRQLEFALFDLKIHTFEGAYSEDTIQAALTEVRAQTGARDIPLFNRFQNSFSHIFAGGYAAGYYSYLWSEVLSADSYASFRKNGLVFDSSVSRRFLSTILEQGGTQEFEALFVEFQGRAPEVEALLKQYQLV